MSATLIIIVITGLISLQSFSSPRGMSQLLLIPQRVWYKKEWYRIITSGFIHANLTHLLFNMLVLYFFGETAEMICNKYFLPADTPKMFQKMFFILFYLVALVVSSIPALIQQKENSSYAALGASGAVTSVLFLFIFFQPWSLLYIWGIIPLPGIIFGALYIYYSYYMEKKGQDNIGHVAHLTGALFGFILPAILRPDLIVPFIYKLLFLV